MDWFACDCGKLPASVNVSRFRGQSGIGEYHFVVCPTEHGSIEAQLEWVSRAYRGALDSVGLNPGTAILRRFFCSDVHNQAGLLTVCPLAHSSNGDGACVVSVVGQPPDPPARLALWACHVSDPAGKLDKTQDGPHLTLRRGDLAHHWTAGITCTAGQTSYDQTRGIFGKYDVLLRERGMSLADNVIRTWLFVQNIDVDYPGLVAARREFFAEHGLTPTTHFIASSGIGGTHADSDARVAMDVYAISGLRPEQIKFLSAPDHLSPTYVYGVTFERGTSVAWQDRKHVFISGTASIDDQGRILYPGDVSRQLDRTLENIEVLLKQAGATLQDMCSFIVYVRDPADYALARRRMHERFGDAPIVIVAAPVCRPGWLIEVEGTAVIHASNPDLPAF
jgi:enamine deaminase RidA (YjgF/YER057c/UK114 family)